MRTARGIFDIPAAEVDTYTRLMSEARDRLQHEVVPAMPLLPLALNAIGPLAAFRGEWVTLPREHQDHVAIEGAASIDQWAMIHTPIKIPQAFRIPKAKKSLDPEWDKLRNKKAFLLDTVREREDVRREATAHGRSGHLCSLMELCHEKHSELP